jgi:acetylornithine deacetylase/succinyl-diaminopimelate desuccinylase-like protein
MDVQFTKNYINDLFDSSIIKELCEYIKIPNQSPSFDEDCLTNGYQDQAIQLMYGWAISQNVENLKVEIHTEEGKTPIIFGVLDAKPGLEDKKPVLMYGHMDKQPPLFGQWKEGLGPYDPVIIDGKLYGRGGADDGYAIYSSIAAIKAIQEQTDYGKVVFIIEASEESGSPDLPFWVNKMADQIGDVGLVVCLDSGCATYDQMWMTTSLRGCISLIVRVDVLHESVHSGMASGIVPSSFRILRQLLDRIEDQDTGKLLLDELYTNIPENRTREAEEASEEIGHSVYSEFPFVEGAKPVHHDLPRLLLQRTWEPQLTYIGVDGIPGLGGGGVHLGYNALKLSIRIPPHVNSKLAAEALVRELTRDPPYGAKVTIDSAGFQANGWESPPLQEWLLSAIQDASQDVYQKPARYWGEGFTIPFMCMLHEKFPQAQFVITGVLGPQSNAHGPNEFLHIDMAKNLTSCVALIVAKYFQK